MKILAEIMTRAIQPMGSKSCASLDKTILLVNLPSIKDILTLKVKQSS